MEHRPQVKPGDPEYQRLAREEIEHYSSIFLGEEAPASAQETLVQPVPPSWTELERRASDRIRKHTGFDLSGHMLNRLRAGNSVRMLSLGCGPGGVEIGFAREARQARLVCVDLNPDLVRLGSERARSEGLNIEFQVGDLNLIELPAAEFDLVFCHASLHHVLELKRIGEQIRKTLRPGGELITIDVCTRNGYLMWPETREIVQRLFRSLPPKFRINHTGYAKPKLDEEIWENDTSMVSMECIRAQEIVPLLERTLKTVHYVPYFSISRRLLDTMYGPNFDLQQPLDQALFNWIWELDTYYLDAQLLKPETFFGIYAK